MINEVLGVVNNWMYSYFLIGLLIIAGLFFTVRMGLVQFRFLPEGIRLLWEKSHNEDAVSPFQALMISTASRVGTGNIAGVSTAIATGGPGAVFWMWLIALIGAASAFVESTLAQIYKVHSGKPNEYRGGPSYYIEQALGLRWVGVLFSIMLIACFAYGFNTLQANNLVSALSHYFGGEYHGIQIPVIIGLLLAGGTAYVIYGGQKKIAFMTSVIVPIMALIYLGLGLFIILKNMTALPLVIGTIFADAFDFRSLAGGLAGTAVMEGIKRGLFSNEAGMGSAPNAAASADVSHPVKQGLVQMLSVFIDTLVICSTTAFIILLSGVETTGLKAMPLMQTAVASQLGEIGILFISISVFFFAFTSIIGNYYYTESNMFYIMRKHGSLHMFRATVIAAVFLGCIVGYDFAWNLADVLMGFMTMINILSILVLGGRAKRALKDYIRQRNQGKDPVFVAERLGITDCQLWKAP